MSVEIKLRRKYVKVTSGSQKSGGGRSGSTKKRMEQPRGSKEAAQAITKANRMMLVLVDGKRRTWVRAADMK